MLTTKLTWRSEKKVNRPEIHWSIYIYLLFQLLNDQPSPTSFSKNVNSAGQKFKMQVADESYCSFEANRNLPCKLCHLSKKIDQISSDLLDRLTVSKPMSRID